MNKQFMWYLASLKLFVFSNGFCGSEINFLALARLFRAIKFIFWASKTILGSEYNFRDFSRLWNIFSELQRQFWALNLILCPSETFSDFWDSFVLCKVLLGSEIYFLGFKVKKKGQKIKITKNVPGLRLKKQRSSLGVQKWLTNT